MIVLVERARLIIKHLDGYLIIRRQVDPLRERARLDRCAVPASDRSLADLLDRDRVTGKGQGWSSVPAPSRSIAVPALARATVVAN